MCRNMRMCVSVGGEVLVREGAVVEDGRVQYVFIDKGDGYVQPRKVRVSAEAGERVGIEQGLKPGERVVTAANFVVDSESRLKGAFAGMGSPSQAPAGTGSAAEEAILVVVLDPQTHQTRLKTPPLPLNNH